MNAQWRIIFTWRGNHAFDTPYFLEGDAAYGLHSSVHNLMTIRDGIVRGWSWMGEDDYSYEQSTGRPFINANKDAARSIAGMLYRLTQMPVQRIAVTTGSCEKDSAWVSIFRARGDFITETVSVAYTNRQFEENEDGVVRFKMPCRDTPYISELVTVIAQTMDGYRETVSNLDYLE